MNNNFIYYSYIYIGMDNNLFYPLIFGFLYLLILYPKRSCRCDKFKSTEHFKGFDSSNQNIIRNNCSVLKSDASIINNLQEKTCKINNNNITDRERISIINNCRDFTEMEIFNSRESNSWCKGIPEPNIPKSLKNKDAGSEKTNDLYPAIGKIVLNGNYYLIDNLEKPKDSVLTELKLESYSYIKPKIYAEKL